MAEIEHLYSILAQKDQQILTLSTDLLKVDQKYTNLLINMKSQHDRKVSHYRSRIKVVQEENNKLKKEYHMLNKKINKLNEQYSISRSQIDELKSVFLQKEQKIRNLQNDNRMQQNRLEKQRIKVKEISYENTKLKAANKKFQEDNEKIKVKLKKEIKEKEKLEAWIQDEALETENKINHLQQTLKSEINQRTQKMFDAYCLDNKKTQHQIYPVVNEWEADMKCLKGCIDLGSSYIGESNPNLYHQVSHQVLRHIKTISQQKEKMKKQVKYQENQLAETKQKLNQFEYELKILLDRKERGKYGDMQNVHTQTEESFKIESLVEKIMTERMKNNVLVDVINGFAAYGVWQEARNRQMKGKLGYYRIFEGRYWRQRQKLKKKNKFRTAAMSIFFIGLLKRKTATNRQHIPEEIQTLDRLNRGNICQLYRMSLENIQNLQIEQLKTIMRISYQQIPEKLLNIIKYHELKVKTSLKGNIEEQLWKFRYRLQDR